MRNYDYRTLLRVIDVGNVKILEYEYMYKQLYEDLVLSDIV
jgi:hypothetical protein